jgi:phosphatidylglycerophosphatase A
MSTSPPISPRRLPLSVWLATGFGVGLFAPAPGTFGAAIGSLLAWGITYIPGHSGQLAWGQLAAILLLLAIGIPLCTAAGNALGGKKDNQAIIWDEITTVPLVFLFVPLANWKTLLAGFVLHRLFDITKPPPARQLEQLPEGLGVMADDVIAALYAALTLYLVNRFAWPLGA